MKFLNYRFLLYLLANFILLPILKFLSKFLKLFNFIFLVYPGSVKEINYYGPLWVRSYVPLVSIIGTVWSNDAKYRGLVASIPFLIDELKKGEEDLLKKIFLKTEEICKSLNISNCALAGRLPSLYIKNNLILKTPFLMGDKGTIFSIMETLEEVIKKEKFQISKITIGVIGLGFIGKRIFEELKKMGFKSIIGFDIGVCRLLSSETKTEKIYNNFYFLSQCDLVLILTREGQDIKEIIPYFKDNVVIIDDTYPFIPKDLIKILKQEKRSKIYRVVMTFKDLRFIPPLPIFKNHEIPGCLVESIVFSNMKENDNISLISQQSFNLKAREIGIKPKICLY
jgi:hypothetical protein